MKIGVVTFTNTLDNYGQVLQCLATLEYLRSRGHDASVVQPVDCRCVLRPSFGDKLRHVFGRVTGAIYRHTLGRRQPVRLETPEIGRRQQRRAMFARFLETTVRKEKEHPRFFEDFRRKNFTIVSGRCDEVLAHGFKAFCTGSDQIWGSASSSLFLLDWVPAGIKRFSIAPSTGGTMPSRKQIPAIRRALRRYEFITVREKSGLEFCRKCGRHDAVQVLDPVFLVGAQKFQLLAMSPDVGKRYVLIYMLGGEIDVPIHEMSAFCKANGLEVRYVESQGRDEPNEKARIDATVEEWLGLMAGAEYVITNSFHGMAMSIVFHKPFLAFELVGLMAGMNGRIHDLAESMKLEDRIFSGDLHSLFNPVDWTAADKCISANRKKVDALMEGISL